MATAREEEPQQPPYEGGSFGAGGKFRKRPFRRATHTTPYDRPPTAFRNPSNGGGGGGWLSKLVDPAHRLITYSAHRLFNSVFRKRLTPPPQPQPPSPGSAFSLIFFFFLMCLFMGLTQSWLCIYIYIYVGMCLMSSLG